MRIDLFLVKYNLYSFVFLSNIIFFLYSHQIYYSYNKKFLIIFILHIKLNNPFILSCF